MKNFKHVHKTDFEKRYIENSQFNIVSTERDRFPTPLKMFFDVVELSINVGAVSNATSSTASDRGIHRARCTLVVSRSFNTKPCGLARFHPKFEREPHGSGQRPHFSLPSTNLMRGLAPRRLFRVPPHSEGTMHLQTYMPSLGFRPEPDCTALSH
ncbi:hypothetical protein TNCV_4340191 [Trichonephila clavipes]|nr:hypothetical protein TNCV_4340191 [Trichonephila clavipes]